MGDWVDAQREQITDLAPAIHDGWSISVAEMALKFGRDAAGFCCWRVKEGWIDYQALIQWIERRSAFRVSDPYNFRVEIGTDYFTADLHEDVLTFELGRNFYVSGNGNSIDWPKGQDNLSEKPFVSIFGRALEEAWGIPAGDVHQFFTRSKIRYMPAGAFQDRTITAATYPVVRES
jgi:hypothetical protein